VVLPSAPLIFQRDVPEKPIYSGNVTKCPKLTDSKMCFYPDWWGALFNLLKFHGIVDKYFF
jgi:hypothetical protein